MQYAFRMTIFLIVQTLLISCANPDASHPSLQENIEHALSENNVTLARQQLRDLSKQFPQIPLIYSALGFQCDKQHDFEEARSAYQKAVNLAPSRPEWWNNLGVFLCQHYKTMSGRKALHKAYQLASTDEKSWIAENIEHC